MLQWIVHCAENRYCSDLAVMFPTVYDALNVYGAKTGMWLDEKGRGLDECEGD